MDSEKRRGRPPEDRVLRRLEIYAAVMPLLERSGAHEPTVRQIAQAANVSVSTLYKYFPSKRAMLTYGATLEGWGSLCDRLTTAREDLRTSDPAAYVEAFVEETADLMYFIRPALHTGLASGAPDIMDQLHRGAGWECDVFDHTLSAVRDDLPENARSRMGNVFHRYFLTTMIDRAVPRDEVVAGIWQLIGRVPTNGEFDRVTRSRRASAPRAGVAARELVRTASRRAGSTSAHRRSRTTQNNGRNGQSNGVREIGRPRGSQTQSSVATEK